MAKRKHPATARGNSHGEHKKQRLSSNANPKDETQTRKKAFSNRPLIPFDQSDDILFVGEGNFSFAASCVENHLEHAENVVATSLDDEATVLDKYGDAAGHMEAIRECCGQVLHGIDATRLEHHLKGRLFDVVIFCFPHVAAGIADEDRNILKNQTMLLKFFESAKHVLKPGGRVAVTLAVSRAYALWDLKGLGKKQKYTMKTSGIFIGSAFPGYGTGLYFKFLAHLLILIEHRRTQGHTHHEGRTFASGKGEERDARWYIFERPKSV